MIKKKVLLVDCMPTQKAKKLGIREIYPVVSKSLAIKASYIETLGGFYFLSKRKGMGSL